MAPIFWETRMGLEQCLRQSLEEKLEQCCKDLGWEKGSYQSMIFECSLMDENAAVSRVARMFAACPRVIIAEPCDAQRTIDIPGALLDRGMFLAAYAGAPGGGHMLEFIKKGGLPGFLQRMGEFKLPGRLMVRAQRRALRGGVMIAFLELEPHY